VKAWDLRQSLVVASVLLAVGEEVVDDQPADWEEEDKKTPEDLMNRWAGGLEHLNENQNVQDQDDQTDDTTSGAIVYGIALDADIIANRGGHGEGGEEGGENEEKHFAFVYCIFYCILFRGWNLHRVFPRIIKFKLCRWRRKLCFL